MTSSSDASFQEKFDILHSAQTGNVNQLKAFHTNNPHVHWSEIRYDKIGDTILHTAARLGHVDFIQYLLTKYEPATNFKNKDCKTALHEAAQFAKADVVRILLEHNADVNALKRADWTPLMLACTKVINEADNYECANLLLKAGALVNLKNKDHWTALHLISREGSTKILKLLCEHGLDPFAITNNGRSALHVASLHGKLDVVNELIKLGLDINLRDNCGNTPLHEAVLGSNTTLCDHLLNCKADLRAINNSGFGVLHLAASVGKLPMIKYLHQQSLDINVQNINGLTPLHCAARKQHFATVDLLKKLGADYSSIDKFGRSATDYLQ